jgi:hypothetical protein
VAAGRSAGRAPPKRRAARPALGGPTRTNCLARRSVARHTEQNHDEIFRNTRFFRTLLDAQSLRSWKLVDGRIIAVSVERYDWGNHPVLCCTDIVAVDPIERRAWLIEQRWHMDDYPEKTPRAVALHGSSGTMAASSYRALMGSKYLPAGYADGRIGEVHSTVTLVDLPWQCEPAYADGAGGPRPIFFVHRCEATTPRVRPDPAKP